MGKKAKAKPTDRATPVLHRPTKTDNQRVTVTRDVTSTAAKNPGWQNATDLQTVSKAWNQIADSIEANTTVVVGLRSQLKIAEAKQVSLRRAWRVTKKQVLSTADVLCAGSADDLRAYGFDVLVHGAPGQPVGVPGPLSTAPGGASGEVSAKWPKGDARHGFVVQHATDVANPATFSAPIPCTKCKITLTGQTPATSVYFRVAAIDPSSPTGQTAWSAWVAGTVR